MSYIILLLERRNETIIPPSTTPQPPYPLPILWIPGVWQRARRRAGARGAGCRSAPRRPPRTRPPRAAARAAPARAPTACARTPVKPIDIHTHIEHSFYLYTFVLFWLIRTVVNYIFLCYNILIAIVRFGYLKNVIGLGVHDRTVCAYKPVKTIDTHRAFILFINICVLDYIKLSRSINGLIYIHVFLIKRIHSYFSLIKISFINKTVEKYYI